jgi:hypothetical protein
MMTLPGMQPVAPDGEALRSFLRDYIAPSRTIQLVAIQPEVEHGVTGKWFGDDHEGAASWAEALNRAGANLYFTLNASRPIDKKPGKDDIVTVHAFGCDIDPPALDWNLDCALADVMTRGRPSYVIATGRGLQPVWIAARQGVEAAVAEQVNRGLSVAFGGDHTHNVDRLYRLVGCVNHLNAKKRAAGFTPKLASLVVQWTGVTSAPEELVARFPAPVEAVLELPIVNAVPRNPGWCGPEDDDELIAIMISETPSLPSAMTAMTRDIWQGNADALTRRYPDKAGGFNHSEVDSSLLTKLRFYTGDDLERMERIFQRWTLFRPEKWNRESYRTPTLSKVMAMGGKVYCNEKYRLQPRSITVDDLVAEYAYCPSSSRPVVPIRTDDPSAGMGYENFKRDMTKWCTPDENGKSVNPAHIWQYRRDRLTIHGIGMRPDREGPVYHEGEKAFINTYYPPVHVAEGGGISEGLRFFEHLLPDETERRWFIQWISHKLRYPSIPGIGVIMVAARDHGTGRGSLTNQLLPALFGQRYVAKVELSDLTGRDGQSQFNEFATDSLIVTVDEASDDGSSPRYAQRRKAYDALKTLVEPAARQMRVKRKFGLNGSAWTFASYIICTNHKDAIAIPHDDRRFAVLSNGVRMPEAFRFEFHAWVADPANVAAFAHYLQQVDISDFSPYRDPPATAAKLDMADASQSDIDRAVADILADTVWLPGQVFTVQQVIGMINQKLPHHEWRLPEEWVPIARKAVQNVGHRVGIRDGKNWTISHGGKEKVAVYARTSQMATNWRTRIGLSEEVRKNDGRIYMPPPMMEAANGNLPGVAKTA